MSNSIVLASIMIVALVIILPVLFHLTRYIGVSSENVRKGEIVEGGVRQVYKDSFERFNVKYFLVGIIFIIFDVEILFMFPWALNLRDLGMFAFIEMFVFIALLFTGLVYVYNSEILKWK